MGGGLSLDVKLKDARNQRGGALKGALLWTESRLEAWNATLAVVLVALWGSTSVRSAYASNIEIAKNVTWAW
jgi:hypothetical protein